ncbi:uncharacterized protein PG986_011461 [Apiospora aurea]|uniref:Uncharacterized protein n=1 Tax=Apiospora aurea TaxID=335848 RepID=A0ABR1Q5C2_9PEZI
MPESGSCHVGNFLHCISPAPPTASRAGFDGHFLYGKTTLRAGFNQAYDANVTGTNVMTWTFIPLLLKSPTTPPPALPGRPFADDGGS